MDVDTGRGAAHGFAERDPRRPADPADHRDGRRGADPASGRPERGTALGYHHAGDGSLALDPVGRQGNAGILARLWNKLAGTDESLVWYQLRGDRGPGTSALAVGAAPGTDVYSPVTGTVVGITDFVLANRTYGARIDIRPQSAPSVVVSLTHLRADPSLTVGSAVAKAASKIGVVVDLTGVERQALARYTQDAGNNVSRRCARPTPPVGSPENPLRR